MKYILLIPALTMVLAFSSCGDEELENDVSTLSEMEISGLLFMLEEEKLARDVYRFLDEVWSLNQFSNIKGSEENHMNYVTSTLDMFKIKYSILPEGEFENVELHDLYQNFIDQGKVSSLEALRVGATFEDIDLADLTELIGLTTNTTLTELYERLMCGSKNHMRSFVKGIKNKGSNYEPQFITEQLYNEIISSQNNHCH